MKAYKKSVLLLGMAMLSGGSIIAAETKARLSNKIMIAHEKFFLFEPGRLSFEDDRENWKQALNDLQNYVNKNAVANTVLKDAAQLVKRVGDKLAEITTAETNKLLSNELEETKHELLQESFWWMPEQKEAVKDLLLEVIDLLQKTINRAVAKAGILKPIEEQKEKPPKKVVDKAEKLIPIYMMGNAEFCPVQPCFDSLGVKNGLDRKLLQISMAEQIEARCGGLSLINALWTEKYTKSGNKTDLTYLHNPNNVKKILDRIGCGNWVDIGRVKAYVESAKNQGYDTANIDAISSVLVVDKNLAEFLFGEEVTTGQELKNKVRKGFNQDFFFHGIIIGDEEARVGGSGHYFAFVIIKSGNQVQYVVIDSLDTNHLTPDSYNRRRIDYLIDYLETGKAESLIPFTRFQAMVNNLKIEIETDLNKIEKDRKLLNQKEFIEKQTGNLVNLQNQIGQYRVLSGNPAALQKEQKQIEEMMQF